MCIYIYIDIVDGDCTIYKPTDNWGHNLVYSHAWFIHFYIGYSLVEANIELYSTKIGVGTWGRPEQI